MRQCPENEQRAQRATCAMWAFAEGGGIDADFRGFAVRQLLSTLGHYCDSRGLNYRRINAAALRQWQKERQANDT